MTIAAGFTFADGVMVFADSQYTIDGSKIDGLKVGRIDASWGCAAGAFAGNVDFAAAAFQQCERASESKNVKRSPVDALGEILEAFYRRHILDHPDNGRENLDYFLFLAIKLKRNRIARLYRTQETVLREIRSFDCAGSGEEFGREVLRFLHRSKMKLDYATALAAYMLAHVKTHAQFCGGSSRIIVLKHGEGDINVMDTPDIEALVHHIEDVAQWFGQEAQQFMLGHTFGDQRDFAKRLDVLNSRAIHIRHLWDSRPSMQSGLQPPKPDSTHLPPWPE